jgi:hypothetical protein
VTRLTVIASAVPAAIPSVAQLNDVRSAREAGQDRLLIVLEHFGSNLNRRQANGPGEFSYDPDVDDSSQTFEEQRQFNHDPGRTCQHG